MINTLEIYLPYFQLGKQEKKGNFTHFFEKMDNINKYLSENSDCLIFLELDSALQYSRFINESHVILKVYVRESAIQGSSFGLTLKKSGLNKRQIQGCYPDWAKGLLFLENPVFDEKYQRALIPSLIKQENLLEQVVYSVES